MILEQYSNVTKKDIKIGKIILHLLIFKLKFKDLKKLKKLAELFSSIAEGDMSKIRRIFNIDKDDVDLIIDFIDDYTSLPEINFVNIVRIVAEILDDITDRLDDEDLVKVARLLSGLIDVCKLQTPSGVFQMVLKTLAARKRQNG